MLAAVKGNECGIWLERFVHEGKLLKEHKAKLAMVLVTPGMWEVVSREAWQVSICSAKMQSSQAALVWPIVLLPMPLLVYCHTCK